MSDAAELGAFLKARRAALHPADLGLPQGITQRRVKGLRREELAQLAGISVDYYTRLEQGSTEFRTLWATHTVRQKAQGRKVMRNPVVGELRLRYETLRLPDDPDQGLVVYHAEPGSATERALALLASWITEAPTGERPGVAPHTG
jgi:hypothetical protein